MGNFMSGSKTYMVSIGILLTAVGAWAHGDLTLISAVDQALTGLGLAALRNGIATK
jgi:ABC-type uncharacterized transport system permease subunit